MRARHCALAGLILLAATLAPSVHAQRFRAVPIAGAHDMVGGNAGLNAGVAWLRLRQHQDSIATRPSTTTIEAMVAPQANWRLAVGYDGWKPGNRGRVVAAAFIEQMPLTYFRNDLLLNPLRAGAEVTTFRQMGETWWLYAGLSWRHGSRDESSYRATFPDCTPTPFGCAVPAAKIPMASLSLAPSLGRDAPAFSLYLAQIGRLRDTRDNVFAPSRGRYIDVGVQLRNYRLSDDDFPPGSTLAGKIDFRGFIGEQAGGVWAFRALAGIEDGGCCYAVDLVDIRHWAQSSTLGAAVFSRFLLRAEYRAATRSFNHRVGSVVFAELAGSATESGQSGEGPLFTGLGLRYRLNREARTTLRLEGGIYLGGQSTIKPLSLRLALGEAF